MRIIGNLLWWLFGGLEAAIGYFTGSLAMAITIIGIPVALQTFKIGLLCLWPFGAEVRDTDMPPGCVRIPLNILWIVFGGLWAWLVHIFFGVLLFVTVVGIPFAKQHFKMAGLSPVPSGKGAEFQPQGWVAYLPVALPLPLCFVKSRKTVCRMPRFLSKLHGIRRFFRAKCPFV